METEGLIGVIMAAGKGTRMEPFSNSYPKSLLPVCNKPIMEHHIDIMKSVGIREIVIVIGHLGFHITNVIGNGKKYGVSVKYVEQTEHLGIAHAVRTLEHYINRPFLLFLGDIFFIPKDFRYIIEKKKERGANAVLAVKMENDHESIKRNFAIMLDEDGFVKRVIEKPRYVKNSMKGCGIYLFDLHIFDAIRHTPRTAMRDEYELTDSIQILINDDYKVEVAEVIKSDINITYPYDLLRCNIEQLEVLGKEFMIGENSNIDGIKVSNSVIGDNCDINGPEIKNSLVFPNVAIDLKKEVNCSIITPDKIVDCSNDYTNTAIKGI